MRGAAAVGDVGRLVERVEIACGLELTEVAGAQLLDDVDQSARAQLADAQSRKREGGDHGRQRR
jgi:hypothetical protein